MSTQQHAGANAFSFVFSAYETLPGFELDCVDALSTPAQSPIATPPLAFGWGHDTDYEFGSPGGLTELPDASSPSSYSSLEGWAGSPLPHSVPSPISSPLAKGQHYVHGPIVRAASPGVMEKAFAAAGAFACDPWGEPFLCGPDALGGPSPFGDWGEQALAAYQFPPLPLALGPQEGF